MKPLKLIKFHGGSSEYGFLSNFYPSRIVLNGKDYPTTEHYFQACKADTTAEHERVRRARTPGEAKRLGREVKLRPDWEHLKEAVMWVALEAKFEQHVELRQMLLATFPYQLIEHAPWDDYWGDGGDGKGKNRLGKLLMRLRDVLAERK